MIDFILTFLDDPSFILSLLSLLFFNLLHKLSPEKYFLPYKY